MSPGFDYHRPKDRAAAIHLLSRPGYDAIPLLVHPKPISLKEISADAVVDLSSLRLDYIRLGEEGMVHVGALSTLQGIVESPLLKKQTKNLLNHAAWLIAPFGIRNAASLWGAIQAHNGSPEFILALLALEAQLEILKTDESQRTLSFAEYYEAGEKFLEKGEIIIETCFKPLPETGCGWALERISRTPRDEAIVASLALVEASGGNACRVRLALGGVNPLPVRLHAVETSLEGHPVTPDALQEASRLAIEQSAPTSDLRGSTEYRREMAGVVVRRALQHGWEQAIG